MNAPVFVVLALAGGLGAVARLMLDGLIRSRSAGPLPWGTILINITGSFALGLLTAVVAGHMLDDSWKLVLGTGFLGGYTTFSTASFETVRLLQERKIALAVVNGLGVLVVAAIAAGLGLFVGSLL